MLSREEEKEEAKVERGAIEPKVEGVVKTNFDEEEEAEEEEEEEEEKEEEEVDAAARPDKSSNL